MENDRQPRHEDKGQPSYPENIQQQGFGSHIVRTRMRFPIHPNYRGESHHRQGQENGTMAGVPVTEIPIFVAPQQPSTENT